MKGKPLHGRLLAVALACTVCFGACGTDHADPSKSAPATAMVIASPSTSPLSSPASNNSDEYLTSLTNQLTLLLDANPDTSAGLYRDLTLGLVVNLKAGVEASSLKQQINAIDSQIAYRLVPRSMSELKKQMDAASRRLVARSIPGAIGVRIDTANNTVLLLSNDPAVTRDAVSRDSALSSVGVEAGQMGTGAQGG